MNSQLGWPARESSVANDSLRRLRRILAPLVCAALAAAAPAWGYEILISGGDGPGVQRWIAGLDDFDVGEAFVPIELDPSDPNVAYLNVAVNFNGDAVYAPYVGSNGLQDEWVIVNLPVEIPFGPGHYHGGFFPLTDAGAKFGSFFADFWVTSVPLVAVSPASGTYYTTVSVQTFDRGLFGTPSTQGPSGWSAAEPEPGGHIDRPRPASVSDGPSWALQASASATRDLPDRQQQVNAECFITSVAMSMRWLAQQNPRMFGAALPAIADLIAAMKQTDEWKDHNIIRWGHLSEWKGTIFNQYRATVVIHRWNGTDDAYVWMKGQLDAGEDVEMSMGYKPVANGDGHTVILTGWSEDGNRKYVTAVDPLEPNKNGRQFNKRIRVTGADVDYPSTNGTAIREIDAESPDRTVPSDKTTWGRVKGLYR
jgi:hypothetical protein